MSVGKRIAELRKTRGINQIQLSKALNVSPSTIAMWETDKRAIKDDDLVQIADFFNVSIDYLLGRSSEKEYWELTDKDEKDVQKTLEEMLDGLSNEESLAFMKNGDSDLSDEDAALLKASLEQTIRLSKELAKKKYTRKDLRGDKK